MIKAFQKNNNIVTILVFVYFLNLALYSICSFLKFSSAESVFWFSRIPLLIILYLITGKNNIIYLLALLLYQLASYLFASEDQNLFIFGSISSIGYKFLLLLILFPLITKKKSVSHWFSLFTFFRTVSLHH